MKLLSCQEFTDLFVGAESRENERGSRGEMKYNPQLHRDQCDARDWWWCVTVLRVRNGNESLSLPSIVRVGFFGHSIVSPIGTRGRQFPMFHGNDDFYNLQVQTSFVF